MKNRNSKEDTKLNTVQDAQNDQNDKNATKVVYFPEQRKSVSGMFVLMLLGMFIMFIFVISGYSSISANNLDNIELQENIDTMRSEIEMLGMHISEKEDIVQIQERAGELGMDFPDADQIVDLPASPIEVPEYKDYSQESSGIFDLISTVRGWFS